MNNSRFSVFRLLFYAVVTVLVAVYVATIFEANGNGKGNGKGREKMATKPSNHNLNGWLMFFLNGLVE